MPKNLVIVESVAKAKTLEKFLGKEFKVYACGGHVRDLPQKKLGVDIEQNFKPTYVVIKGKEQIIKTLKGAAEKVNLILLAPDPDREGEAIAWHLKDLLGGNGRIKRIEFNEITKKAVEEAVATPRDIDLKRVNAQQARRILDRLVGYRLSPLLWKKVRKGLSAGRVQSVVVRLLCEREKEIQEFKKEEYWTITAHLTPISKKEPFQAKLEGLSMPNKKSADSIASEIEAEKFIVLKITKKEIKRNPPPPFITSTLQQEASKKLGFTAKKTMVIAQQLYEGIQIKDEGYVGLITYMRTDSVRIAREAIEEVRKYIDREFGNEFLPKEGRVYKAKKQAQDAHEGIRPTSVYRTPDKIKQNLTPDQYRLYDLIWSRFVACEAESAILAQTGLDIKAGKYLLRATGSAVKFNGFFRIYIDREEEERILLPELEEGQELKLLKLEKEQHFTEPRGRYTEASLIKELEEKGIGRPSTYAPIIATIQERGYVVKEGKSLRPTEIGLITNSLLLKHFPDILDIKFTAHMEDDLDDILSGKIDWISTLKEFYEPFAKDLKDAEEKMEKVKKEELTEEKCPRCGKPLVIRASRYGEFLACSGFPKCRFTKAKEVGGEEKVEEVCEKCGKPMTLKRSRYGSFLACTGYPQCKNIRPLVKSTGVKCPVSGCNGELVERKTRKGRIFYSCSNYPKCSFATWERPPQPRKEH